MGELIQSEIGQEKCTECKEYNIFMKKQNRKTYHKYRASEIVNLDEYFSYSY